MAVSKTFPASDIRQAWEAGQRCFGENYVQEALAKIAELRGLRGLQWHFIGPLQGNKARAVAEHFDWVHSVDRLALAERLSAARPTSLPPLQICLQVNISGEESKSGVSPAEVPALACAVARLPRLALRGLMAIPAPLPEDAPPTQQRAPFAELRSLLAKLQSTPAVQHEGVTAPTWDTLSMGMSGDLEAAIAEGATIVRVGTAIFGARPPAAAAPH